MIHRGMHETFKELCTVDFKTVELPEYLHKNELLNNTVLFIFGDHGMRFGKTSKNFYRSARRAFITDDMFMFQIGSE